MLFQAPTQIVGQEQVHDPSNKFLIEDVVKDYIMQDNTPLQDLSASASDKRDSLWSNVIADTTSAEFPSNLKLLGMFAESMNPTFDTPGDLMPSTWLGKRVKYIHSVGVVSKVSFKANEASTYSGIFQGASQGLIRMSAAIQPNASQTLVPGFGLKFLRDGQDSCNLVAMYSINGQFREGQDERTPHQSKTTLSDWNFFDNSFTNHHVGPAENLKVTALVKKFEQATQYVESVGLSNCAKYDEAGQQTEDQGNFPFELRFEPHEDVQNRFDWATLPVADDYLSAIFDLKGVPANTNLYKVFAWDKPQKLGGKESYIGDLVMDGQFTSSKFGDEDLFFRHQRTDEDLKIHPEWTPYKAVGAKEAKCPFASLWQ